MRKTKTEQNRNEINKLAHHSLWSLISQLILLFSQRIIILTASIRCLHGERNEIEETSSSCSLTLHMFDLWTSISFWNFEARKKNFWLNREWFKNDVIELVIISQGTGVCQLLLSIECHTTPSNQEKKNDFVVVVVEQIVKMCDASNHNKRSLINSSKKKAREIKNTRLITCRWKMAVFKTEKKRNDFKIECATG